MSFQMLRSLFVLSLTSLLLGTCQGLYADCPLQGDFCPDTGTETVEAPTEAQRDSQQEQPSAVLADLREAVSRAEAFLDRLEDGLERATRLLNADDTLDKSGAALAQVQQQSRLNDQAHLSFSGNVALRPFNANQLRTVSRRLPAWQDHFTFLSAVRTDARVLCATVIRRSLESLPRFIALGDESGRVYLFTPQGDLAAEHFAGGPVTSLLSHQPRSNQTTLVIGLESGQILLLSLEQQISRSVVSGSEVATVAVVDRTAVLGGKAGAGRLAEGGRRAVQHLALIPSGSKHGFQYVAAHANGSLAIWRPDGTLRQTAHLEHPIRLMSVVGKYVLLIHSKGTATWQFSTPKEKNPAMTLRACRGLNDSRISAAVFQPGKRGFGRYFALADNNKLLTMGSQILTNCEVLNSVDAVLPIEEPVTLASLPGYLLLGTSNFAALYNTTGAVSRWGPAGVLAASIPSIAMTAGLMGSKLVAPLLLAAAPKHAVVAIGPSLVATFQSTLHQPGKVPPAPMLAWARPAIIILVALVGVWHFGNRRQSKPFATRRGPDMVFDRGFGGPTGRAGWEPRDLSHNRLLVGRHNSSGGFPRHEFGSPDALKSMATELDSAVRNERGSKDAVGVEGPNQQMLGQIDQAMRARKRAKELAKQVDQDLRTRTKHSQPPSSESGTP